MIHIDNPVNIMTTNRQLSICPTAKESNKTNAVRHKKAQQEIVGFIVIVLIIVIAGVIYLGIWLRQDHEVIRQDAEISKFIQASTMYTTECYETEGLYKNLGDTARACYEGLSWNCGAKTSCEVLKDTYSGLMNEFWPASENGLVRASILRVIHEDSQNQTSEIAKISLGANSSKCSARNMGSEPIIYSSGKISVELEICFK